MNKPSLKMRLAQVTAVAFALGVTSFMMSKAQERATGPDAVVAPVEPLASSETAPVAEREVPDAARARELSEASSDPVARAAGAGSGGLDDLEPREDYTFLLSSKSGVMYPLDLSGPANGAPTAPVIELEDEVFLHSSKTFSPTEIFSPTDIFELVDGELRLQHAEPEDGPGDGVFLHSSKMWTPTDILPLVNGESGPKNAEPR